MTCDSLQERAGRGLSDDTNHVAVRAHGEATEANKDRRHQNLSAPDILIFNTNFPPPKMYETHSTRDVRKLPPFLIFGTGRTNSVRPFAKLEAFWGENPYFQVEEMDSSNFGAVHLFQLFSGIRMFQNVYGSVWRKLCYFTNKEACKRSLQLSNCRSDSNPSVHPPVQTVLGTETVRD